MIKKEMIAMLLAGGQGSRLGVLTETVAKPAVEFGGKYRIIDFPLSNCVQSGIDTVGVLTQYQPLDLNEYIGNGDAWDLDRRNGGLFVLPPYQGGRRADWYRGTANAIYQNLNFVLKNAPQYVLILSGDHIYRMNYRKMLRAHVEKRATCTVATLRVPQEEASRFGICNTDEDGRIFEFEEKPKHPRSDLASMGIYIFNTEKLVSVLERDAENKASSNDFGKDIIPTMIKNGEAVYSYAFDGYWKDVGTVRSLWEANMDLLGRVPRLGLNNGEFRIYSRNLSRAPQVIYRDADVSDSLISEGCRIGGSVHHSVLSCGVCVEKGAEVRDSVIMEDVIIKAGAVVSRAMIDRRAYIDCGVRIGETAGTEIAVIGKERRVMKEAIL